MAQSKNSYIPSGVQREMDKQMQRMPANLKKYEGGKTYIPARAAKEMASFMKKSMPAHMQEYITPYMHQQTQAGLNSMDPVSSRNIQSRAPAPDLMRRDHSAFGEQFNVNVNSTDNPGTLSFSPQFNPKDGTPSPAPPPVPLPKNTPGNNQYDFIMNSGNGQKNGLGQKLASGSKTMRIAIFGTGVVALLILAMIFFSILGSGSKSQAESLTSLAQTQAEIVRIATIGTTKANSDEAKNLALTTQLSIQSAQNDTVSLLAKNGHKLNAKILALKNNPQTDKQLDEADNNNSFDDTFIKIMKNELADYQKSLQVIYSQSKSTLTKQMLTDDFTSVSLLLGNQPKNT